MASGERGLVISNPISVNLRDGSLYSEQSWLAEQELRFSLLFWDKLDFPDNNYISSWGGRESDFLEQAGILKRTMVRFQNSMNGAAAVVQAHLMAFQHLDEQEPGVWSLGAGRNSLTFSGQDLDDGRGALVRLFQAIPVPDKEVPLEDILNFRSKRRDELLALRHSLEESYERILGAGDGEMALTREIEKLDRAISDQIKASKESKFKLRLSDIDISLNLVGASIGTGAGLALGLPLTQAILGSAASAVSLNVGAALKRRRPTTTPFKYISSFNQDLF
ncbi:MAG: DUF6236 family protein [Rhizomicrobium sp.]